MSTLGRLSEGALALTGLLFVSPILLFAAVAIRMEDGGPVLFRQQRVGHNGRTFTLLKLRSMRTGQSGPSITSTGDSRVTRVGSRLRRYKLDELPQLWNVFRGEMTFIGPRPELPQYVDRADPRWKRLLTQRPGITGLASLLFRHEEQQLAQAADRERYYRDWLLPAKLDLEERYLRQKCLQSDLKLITFTVCCSFLPFTWNQSRIQRAFPEVLKEQLR